MLKLVVRPRRRAMCETKMRYAIEKDGKEVAEIYWHMRGYCINPGIPLADGSSLQLPECGITLIKKEISKANREWKGK